MPVIWGKKRLRVLWRRAEKKLFRLLQNRSGGEFVPIRQVVLNALGEEVEKASRNKGNVTGLPTGFTDLDYQDVGISAV